MPNELPPIDENETCACCTLCQYAGDNQLVYCHQGTWHTLAAPDFAATLGYDPVTGFQWVPVLAATKPNIEQVVIPPGGMSLPAGWSPLEGGE